MMPFVFVGVVATAAAADTDRCLGEFVSDGHECVLAANGGDVDEPTASHRSCAPQQFLCPGAFLSSLQPPSGGPYPIVLPVQPP
jgi:hypothetical protein